MARISLAVAVALAMVAVASALSFITPLNGDCSKNSDKSSCDSAGCVWCLSGAIPSACYTADQAAKLPAGVFECDNQKAELFGDDEEHMVAETVKLDEEEPEHEEDSFDDLEAVESTVADDAEETDCSGVSSEDACNKESACTWCKSGAIPSACYSLDQAKQLPAGVFECDKTK